MDISIDLRCGYGPATSQGDSVQMQWVRDGRRKVDILLRMGSGVDDDLDVYTGENNMGVVLKEYAMKNQIPESDADGAGDYIKNDDNDNDDETLTGIAGQSSVVFTEFSRTPDRFFQLSIVNVSNTRGRIIVIVRCLSLYFFSCKLYAPSVSPT